MKESTAEEGFLVSHSTDTDTSLVPRTKGFMTNGDLGEAVVAAVALSLHSLGLSFERISPWVSSDMVFFPLTPSLTMGSWLDD